jgi:cytochrome c peroxidase
MQGRGLIDGPVHDSLGPPNRGISTDLDALAAYNNSFAFTLSPHAKYGLSDLAKRGRELFHDEATGCATCHGGPFYTDSTPRPPSEIIRHDVGTGNDDPTETMGPAYDTPTLLGLYRTAPYLHDGRADTLKEVMTSYNPKDQHGVTSHLSEGEIDALVEFLRSLPFEDPVAAAREAKRLKVD